MRSRSACIHSALFLLCAAFALCFAAPSSAQWFGLWSDENMTACEYYGGPYMGFPVVLILTPGEDGVFGAEYFMSFPANIIQNPAPVPFPGIAVSMGDAVGGAGISLGFEACQTEPFVLYTFGAFPISDVPGEIRVLPHPETGIVAVATCEEPLRPVIEAHAYPSFWFNEACAPGTEEASWGAVKAQFMQ